MEIGARWRARAGLAAAVLAGAVGLAGCDVSVRDGSVSVNALGGRATDEWTRQYPLTPGGRVEVVNSNGRIDVVAGQEGVVEVRASRTVRALTDDVARDRLQGLIIDERVTDSLIRIETRVGKPSVGPMSQEVSYRVRVPRGSQVDLLATNGAVSVSGVGGAVRASTTNGSVTGDALSGRVDAASVNGSVQVDLEAVGAAGIRLQSVNGSVRLRVPDSSRANLSARCVNGRIAVTGLPVPGPGGRGVREFDAQLNGGGPTVELHTTNGGIRIEGKN